jgi:superfamily II DNA/RNA helicase
MDSYEENKGLLGVTHLYSRSEDKDAVIFRILELVAKADTQPQVIIFFNTIPELRSFYALLCKEKKRFLINDPQASDLGKHNLKVDYIHRDCTSVCLMSREHLHPYDCAASKTARITKLRNKEIQVLLGTETIGRGIDIRTVTLVINYNEPAKNKELSSTAYIHRVGRTGRYSDEGIALTFVPNSIFVKLAEEEQKISFQEMKSEEDVVSRTVECFYKNERIAKEDKHRYEVE